MEMAVGSRVRSEVAGPGPVLALDTSTDRAAVVLDPGGGTLWLAPAIASRQHGRGLVAAIRDLLGQRGIGPGELAAIGVGLGPGSFTGLRVGLTAAKTLAYAVGCPLFGFDSLEAIARNAPGEARAVVAVGDAQRGDLFVADFAREGDALRRVGPTRLERADTWPSTLAPGTWVLGPPLGRAEPWWPDSIRRGDPSIGYPEGGALMALTRERIASGRSDDPWFLEPAYVRRSAAEEKAAGVVGA